MTVEQLRRLLLAPEIIVVDLTDQALAALRRAILLEHPTIDDPQSVHHSMVLRRAAIVLRDAARLHHALNRYRHAIDRAIAAPPPDDLPF